MCNAEFSLQPASSLQSALYVTQLSTLCWIDFSYSETNNETKCQSIFIIRFPFKQGFACTLWQNELKLALEPAEVTLPFLKGTILLLLLIRVHFFLSGLSPPPT